MKKVIIIIGLAIIAFANGITGQQLVISGNARISSLDVDTTSTKIVVRTLSGTLVVRDSATFERPSHIGQDVLGGIVFHIYDGEDGKQHGLIVSKTESAEKWQSLSNLTGANRTWDGAFNTNQMVNSPAKDWVRSNFSFAWYVPSWDELNILWHNRFHVNKALDAGGHVLLASEGTYWSSTENLAATAFYAIFTRGDTSGNGAKGDVRNVRAIRAF